MNIEKSLFVNNICKDIINKCSDIDYDELDNDNNILFSNIEYMARVIINNLSVICPIGYAEGKEFLVYHEEIDKLLQNLFSRNLKVDSKSNIRDCFCYCFSLFEFFINDLNVVLIDSGDVSFVSFDYCQRQRDDILSALKKTNANQFDEVQRFRKYYKECFQHKLMYARVVLAKKLQ